MRSGCRNSSRNSSGQGQVVVPASSRHERLGSSRLWLPSNAPMLMRWVSPFGATS